MDRPEIAFAFNKHDGQLVWSSTPGTPPKDSSFSSPVLGYYNNKRVLYAGTGCGNLVAINARNGDPLWRYHFSYGGVNPSLLLHNNDKVIAIHGKENLDSSEVGRMANQDRFRTLLQVRQVRWYWTNLRNSGVCLTSCLPALRSW